MSGEGSGSALAESGGHWAGVAVDIERWVPGGRSASRGGSPAVARAHDLGWGGRCTTGGAGVVELARARDGTNSAIVSAAASADEFRFHGGLFRPSGDLGRWHGGRVLRAHAEGTGFNLGTVVGRPRAQEDRWHRRSMAPRAPRFLSGRQTGSSWDSLRTAI